MTDQVVEPIAGNVEDQYVDPQVLADLMAALERVFKIGVYYPAGHAMCDQAADGFLQVMAQTLGKAPSLRFEACGGRLSLQGTTLDPESRGVESFLDLIGGLGIAVVEIDSNVTASDLHEFVTRLLAYRNQIKGARDFQQVVIEGMPLTVTIEHLEFMTREIVETDDGESGMGDRSQPTIEALLATLAQNGLTPEELRRCRKMLEAIPGYLEGNFRDTGGLPQVSWSEVEKLLMTAARTTLEPKDSCQDQPRERSSSHMNLDALTSIFRTLGHKSDEGSPREAIDLLLTQLHRPTPKNEEDSGKPRPKPKPKPMSELMPVNELVVAIAACGREAESETPQLMAESRAEELSILLQMMRYDQKRSVQARIQKRLRDITRTSLSHEEWEIAVAAAQDILDPEREELTCASLQLLMDAVRSSGTQSGLAFLRDVSEGCSAAQIDLLWHFMLNEILLEGQRKHPESFATICTLVARPDREAMQERLGRLENLEAITKKRCARDVVTPIPPELYPVFSLLMGSSRASYLGGRIFEGLKRQPVGWLCRAILPLVKHYEPRYRRFIEEILLQAGRDDVSPALSEAAVRIVAEHLPNLGPRERHESWVPDTLRAVGRLQAASGRQILEEVLGARQFLIFHIWPHTCRQAARSSLAQLRRSPDRSPETDGNV